jgi:hypothetical protein
LLIELETSLGIPLPIKSLLKPGFGLLDLSHWIAGHLSKESKTP